MLNGTLTGKVIDFETLPAGGDFCGRFMLRIAQKEKGELAHYLVECYIPEYMQASLKWALDNQVVHTVVCFDKMKPPSIWEYKEMKVIVSVTVTRIERN